MSGEDVLSGLLPFAWKGVYFPSAAFRVRLKQDVAMHDYADRDGAHVEGTGRAALEFSARIPFINGIDLSPAEAGVLQPVYPVAFRKFLEVAADRSRGDLQHPELGRIKARLLELDTDWSAQTRGGVMVDVTWVEDTDKPSDLESLLLNPSPAQALAEAASDLDAQMDAALENLRTKNIDRDLAVFAMVQGLRETELKDLSFSEATRRLQGIGDSIESTNRRTAAVVDAIEFRAKNIGASLKRAGAHPVYWPIQHAAQRMEAAAIDLKASLGTKKRRIGLYVVAAPSTAPSIAQDLGVKLGDVLSLNPTLAGGPVVLRGTKVRYYLAA
jgi:hypothetical protein